MVKELSDITTKDIEKALKPILITSPTVSKFSIRQKFIELLLEKGVELSKEEELTLHIGDNTDKYSKRINQFMLDRGYSFPTHSYCKL